MWNSRNATRSALIPLRSRLLHTARPPVALVLRTGFLEEIPAKRRKFMGKVTVCIGAVLLAFSVRASADPIPIVTEPLPFINAGFVTIDSEGGLFYSFTTLGFSLQKDSTFFPWSGTGLTIGCAATGCTPGQLFDFTNETAGVDFSGNPSKTAALGGGTLTDCCVTQAETFVNGHWRFNSPGAIVPTSGEEFVMLSAPFAFRGSFDTNRLFARRLGMGTVMVPLQLSGGVY